jgi:hypothetical protein
MCKLKKRLGLQEGQTAEMWVKSGVEEITKHVTRRLMVCQGYIRAGEAK